MWPGPSSRKNSSLRRSGKGRSVKSNRGDPIWDRPIKACFHPCRPSASTPPLPPPTAPPPPTSAAQRPMAEMGSRGHDRCKTIGTSSPSSHAIPNDSQWESESDNRYRELWDAHGESGWLRRNAIPLSVCREAMTVGQMYRLVYLWLSSPWRCVALCSISSSPHFALVHVDPVDGSE